MDKLATLRALVAVADCGSLSRAAKQLGLSKATVSKRLRHLEESLGVVLLSRDGRRLVPTEAGRRLVLDSRPLLDSLARLEEEIAAYGQEPRGELRVSAALSFGLRHLVPRLPEFLRRYPGLRVELLLEDRYADLAAERIDLALRIGRLPDSPLIARKLGTARLLCAASPAYLAARGRPRSPAELSTHECLIYLYGRSPRSWTFERAGQARRVRVRGPLSSNNGELLREAAIAGLGIVRLPDFILDAALERGQLEPVLEQWEGGEIGVYAVYPPSARRVPAVRAFADFLVEALGQRGSGA